MISLEFLYRLIPRNGEHNYYSHFLPTMPNDMPALADMDEESDTDLLQQGTDDESMPATANSALLGSFLTESRYTACFLVFF